MSGYSLSAEWFEYMARNNDKVELKHTAMYLYIVEMFNKREWVEVIGLPTDFTMSVLNIKSYKTYKSILDDLIEFGFVNLVSRATNDHTSNKIALVKNTKADTKVKPKYVPKLNQSNDQSKSESCSIYINIQTIKPETLKLINKNASLVNDNLKDWIENHKEIKVDYEVFEKAWKLYGIKGSKSNSKKQWGKVKDSDYDLILSHIPLYFKTNPDKTYRKDFERYLSSKLWEDKTETTKTTRSSDNKAWNAWEIL